MSSPLNSGYDQFFDIHFEDILRISTYWFSLTQACLEDNRFDFNIVLKQLKCENEVSCNIHLLQLLKYSVQSPRGEFKDKLTELKDFLQNEGFKVPNIVHESPSWFFAPNSFTFFESNDSSQRIFELAKCGRSSNFALVHSIFSDFSSIFSRTLHALMDGNGPLPIPWRYYISIMASAQHHCQYLVSLQKYEFIRRGGKREWLESTLNCPKKLNSLSRVNALLATQPWKVGSEVIEELTRGSQTDNWSLSELVQAFLIISSFHSLSAFCLGSGIVFEPDLPGGNSFYPVLFPTDGKIDNLDFENNTTSLLSLLKQSSGLNRNNAGDQQTYFENCVSDSKYNVDRESKSFAFLTEYEDLSKFKGSFAMMEHADFDTKSLEYSIFRLNEFSWEEHCCSAIARYFPELADLLDDEFREAMKITDHVLSSFPEKVETLPFRQAIWFYVLRITGMFHDDYDYQRVNLFLNKQAKIYIKKITSFPKYLFAKDFFNMGLHFRDSEKIHMNLLACEARKQAEILYSLRAIDEYLNSR